MIPVRRHPSWMQVVSFCLLILLLCAPAWAGSAFEAANEKYKAGDFKGAAAAYEAILKSGEGTSAVEFNLGNALLRAGRKGPALLAYYRALQAEPRNRDLRWNIGVVESALTDRVSDEGAPGLRETLRRTLSWVSVDETARALLACVLILVLAGWLGFLMPGRGIWARLQVAAMVGLVICGILFAGQSRILGRDRVVVLEPEVTLRYGPAFSETKAFTLHEGASAEVLDESGEWWYVSFGKNFGWLPKKSCEII